MNKLAPVVLFVYNRPEHTRRTLEALSKNDLADQSVLHVFADGPKTNTSPADLKKIAEVRELISEQNWCKQLFITESSENLGLAQSVIRGVTQVVNKFDKVIVLEDDIITHHSFLQCLNVMLETYANEPAVYGVTGYKFPSKAPIPEATYFLPVMSSWGYGTWADRWNKIEFNASSLLSKINKSKISNKLKFGKLDFYQILLSQVNNETDSWAIMFYASMILNKGVFLFPNESLIQNIGLDGSGIHCEPNMSLGTMCDSLKESIDVTIEKKAVKVDKRILGEFNNRTLKNRIFRFVKKIIAPEIIDFLRRKFKIDRPHPYEYLRNYQRYESLKVQLLGRTIKIPDSASFKFMYDEIFTHQIYKFYTQTNKPRIIDAGANIGLATIYFKKQFPQAQLIAFEPDPGIMEILKYNLKQFAIEDIELHQVGLWDEDTILSFHREGADGGHIILKEQDCGQQINVISLRPFLQQKTDFLKIDIEGAETKVLEDIARHLDLVERIFIEYHSFINQDQTLGRIIQILETAGFRYQVNSPGLKSIRPFVKRNEYNGMDMQLNIYGFRN